MPRSTATIRRRDSIAILDFRGALMIGESSSLFRKTIAELMNIGLTRIVLNFEELTAVDSAGIGELVAAYATMKAKNMRLKVLNPRQNINNVFKLTKLSDVFDVYSSEQLALESFDEP